MKSSAAVSDAVSLKCIIAGNGSVGKTCLLRRYTHGDFTMKTAPTAGSDYVPKNVQKDNASLKVNFWDCAGQQKYQHVVKTFFKGSHGAILVFDVSNPESFKEVEGWLRLIVKEAKQGVAVLVVGNKSDLRKDAKNPESMVSEEDIKELLEENSGLDYIECSSGQLQC
jgi:small GTP-binding protein